MTPSPRSTPVKKQTLAQQVADSLQNAILAGDWSEGATLPTEPDLCEQFGVSRAVIRDATRLLMARGLVEVRQGAGAFVTPVRNPAFADALLLALRRSGATAWDAEEFEHLLLPNAAALAAVKATDEDVAALRQALDAYLLFHAEHARRWGNAPTSVAPAAETTELGERYITLMEALLAATHNHVLSLLARPLTQLHGLRHWDAPDLTVDDTIRTERDVLTPIIDAVAAHDPAAARAAVTRIQQLPPAAVTAMQRTPIGQVTEIRVTNDA